jgi:ribulose-phosphate 3-epimerase
MIERPEDWVGRYVEAGATYVTVHIEATRDAAGTLDAIRTAGARPGITLNPETDVARLQPYLDRADLVLVMSVHPGFGGQAFIPSALDKVRTLRAALDARGSKAELEVDGGIKHEIAKDVVSAGASVLVAGSAVYLDPDGVAAALAKLRKAIA